MLLTGQNRRTRRKTRPSATLSTTNPKWFDPGANPGLRVERPATNDLSHGTAKIRWLVQSIYRTKQSRFSDHVEIVVTVPCKDVSVTRTARQTAHFIVVLFLPRYSTAIVRRFRRSAERVCLIYTLYIGIEYRS
jgi:hypothetical protein